ncbi:MAG: hypothetical protein AAGJ82_14160 [Bacteroidota bacterium]
MKYSIGLLVLLGCVACQAVTTDSAETDTFFSVEKWTDQEVERLTAAGTELVKTVRMDSKEETQQIADPNYADELDFLRKFDINRPVWVDKYQVDTLRETTGQTLTFRALEDGLNTQLLRVTTTTAGQVQSIYGERRSQSALSNSSTIVDYQTDSGYRLTSTQESRTGQAITIEIAGMFKR